VEQNPFYYDESAAWDNQLWWGAFAWKNVNIPSKFREMITVSGWDAMEGRGTELAELITILQAWAKIPWKLGLLLSGTYGVGKTLLSILTLREMILAREDLNAVKLDVNDPFSKYDYSGLHRPDFAFVNTPHLLTKIRAGFNSKDLAWEDRPEQVLNEYKWRDVLVLDDMGRESPTDWAKSTMFELIDSRYTEGKTTIFTSNYDLDGLAERVSGAVADRMAEMCAGHIYNIKLGSYRLEKAKRAQEVEG